MGSNRFSKVQGGGCKGLGRGWEPFGVIWRCLDGSIRRVHPRLMVSAEHVLAPGGSKMGGNRFSKDQGGGCKGLGRGWGPFGVIWG